ncbi:MAG: hypothetical protein AAF928_15865 [Myxococcota bacterium]
MRWFVLLVATLGCAPRGAPPEVAEPFEVARAEAPVRPVLAVEAADRRPGPVAAPGLVLARGWWRAPRRLSAASVEGADAAALEARAAGLGLGPGIGPVWSQVDAEAPWEAVVYADVEVSEDAPVLVPALSVPLASLDDIVAAHARRRLSPGVWQVTDDGAPGAACAISTVSHAPARLVCTDDLSRLASVAAHAARHLGPPAEPAADFRLDVTPRATFDHYGPRWTASLRRLAFLGSFFAEGEPAASAALQSAAEAVFDDLATRARNLERATVRVDRQVGGYAVDVVVATLEPPPTVPAGVREDRWRESMRLPEALHGVRRSEASRGMRLPEASLRARLPDDEVLTLATGGLRKDAREPTGWRATAADLLARMLDAYAVGRPDERPAWVAVLRNWPPPPGAAWVSATGMHPQPAAWRPMLGFDWYLMGAVGDALGRWGEKLDRVAATLARPAPRTRIAAAFAPPGEPPGRDPAELPVVLTRRRAVPGVAGAWFHRLDIAHAGDASWTAYLGFLTLVTPEGRQTWFALSPDLSALGALLTRVRERGKREGPPSPPGADGRGGSHTTLLGLGVPGLPLAAPLAAELRRRLAPALSQAPHRGRTPLPFEVIREPSSPTVMTYRVTLPPAAVEDAESVTRALLAPLVRGSRGRSGSPADSR